jgi:hypothetical protein
MAAPLLCLLLEDMSPEVQKGIQENFAQTLNPNKFPVSAFTRQLKRFFSHLAT